MQVIFGLTALECIEHVARTMYLMQLLLTPGDWITQNMIDPPTPVAVYMCRLAAVLLLCIKSFALVIQMRAPSSVRPIFWMCCGVSWACCAVNTAAHESLMRKPEFNINVGLQSFFDLAFLASSFFGKAPKFSLKSS